MVNCVLTSVQFNRRFSSCRLRGVHQWSARRTLKHILVDLYFRGDWRRRIKGTIKALSREMQRD